MKKDRTGRINRVRWEWTQTERMIAYCPFCHDATIAFEREDGAPVIVQRCRHYDGCSSEAVIFNYDL